MKDLIETALDAQKLDNPFDIGGIEETDESEDSGVFATRSLDDPEIFNGLHPNHISHVRNKLGNHLMSGSFTRQLAQTNFTE